MPALRAILTALAVVGLPLLAPSVSDGGTYDVWSCRTPDGQVGPVSGWTGTSNEAGGSWVVNQCAERGRLAAFLSPAPTAQPAIWQFDAPPNTRIVGYEMYRNASSTRAPGGAKGYIFYEDTIALDQEHVMDVCVAGGNPSCTTLGSASEPFAPENRFSETGRSARRLYATIQCFSFNACGTTSFSAGFAIYRARITLDDESPPSVSEPSGLIPDSSGAVTGQQLVSVNTSDTGGGLEKAELLVDGVTAATVSMEARGAGCRRPFVAVVPCPLSTSVDLPFDTTRLRDGSHRTQAVVTDAAGNVGRSEAIAVATRNSSRAVPPSPAALPNGSAPDRAARLSVSFGGRQVSTLSYGHTARASGRLTTTSGMPMPGALIGVFARLDQAGARWKGVSLVRTGARGRFAYRPPRGASRRVRFVYRAYSSDTRPAAARTLRLRVRAGIRLSVTRRALRNGQTAAFRTHLLGGPARRGTLVSVQVLRPQRTTFATRKVDRAGVATVLHRFRYTYRPTTYLFRAVVQSQRGYPYLGAASRVVRLRVRP